MVTTKERDSPFREDDTGEDNQTVILHSPDEVTENEIEAQVVWGCMLASDLSISAMFYVSIDTSTGNWLQTLIFGSNQPALLKPFGVTPENPTFSDEIHEQSADNFYSEIEKKVKANRTDTFECKLIYRGLIRTLQSESVQQGLMQALKNENVGPFHDWCENLLEEITEDAKGIYCVHSQVVGETRKNEIPIDFSDEETIDANERDRPLVDVDTSADDSIFPKISPVQGREPRKLREGDIIKVRISEPLLDSLPENWVDPDEPEQSRPLDAKITSLVKGKSNSSDKNNGDGHEAENEIAPDGSSSTQGLAESDELSNNEWLIRVYLLLGDCSGEICVHRSARIKYNKWKTFTEKASSQFLHPYVLSGALLVIFVIFIGIWFLF